MGRRLGQVAGLLLLLMVPARLSRVLESGPDLLAWPLILVAAAGLGALMRWLLHQGKVPGGLAGAISTITGLAVLLRVAVPGTLAAGVIPTGATLPALLNELGRAADVARSGVPPIDPTAGIVAILALLMWALGSLYTIGLLHNRVSLAVIPAALAYIQMAIFDRQPAGIPWLLLSGVALAIAASALAMSRDQDIGTVRKSQEQYPEPPSASAALGMAALVTVAAVVGTAYFAPQVREYAQLPWSGGGSGSGDGNVGNGRIAFDRFVDLRQRLQSRQNLVVFRATLGPDAPPASSLYFRMEALDRFDGIGWSRSQVPDRPFAAGSALGDPQHAYFGTTTEILQRIFVDRLAGQQLPVAGLPTQLHEIDEDGQTIAPSRIRHGRDGALTYPNGIEPGDIYQVSASYPLQDQDLGGLATGSDGQLTPLFAAAAEEGQWTHAPHERAQDGPGAPTDLDSYVELPPDLPAGLTALANEQTQGATTDFERAYLLQHWFRDSGDFTYSLNVTTGNSALNLLDWMTEPNSLNYRTGYCEQFAASMAVLGRLLGIPSRVVWGFTPGTTVEVDGLDVIEIRDTNAHAWVEMWIEGYGWVTFDPTPRGEFLPPSQTAAFDPADLSISAPDPSDPPVDPETPPPPAENPTGPILNIPGFNDLRVPLVVIIAAGLIGGVPLLKRRRRTRRVVRLSEGDITAAWEEIVDRLSDLGAPVSENLTPMEFASVSGRELIPLATDYSAALYGDRSGGESQVDRLTEAESWINATFQRPHRLRAALNPRSLFNKS